MEIKTYRGTGEVFDGKEPIATVAFKIETNDHGQVRAEPTVFRGSWLTKVKLGSRVHIEVDAHHVLVGKISKVSMPGSTRIGGHLRMDSNSATYEVNWTHLEDYHGNRL